MGVVLLIVLCFRGLGLRVYCALLIVLGICSFVLFWFCLGLPFVGFVICCVYLFFVGLCFWYFSCGCLCSFAGLFVWCVFTFVLLLGYCLVWFPV